MNLGIHLLGLLVIMEIVLVESMASKPKSRDIVAASKPKSREIVAASKPKSRDIVAASKPKSRDIVAASKPKSRDIIKRHLRWNADREIVSINATAYPDLEVDYLVPHSKCVPVENTNAVYMAFTLYKRSENYIARTTGVFHVIDLDTVLTYSKCGTNHANAYYHFYGSCPNDDSGIVASGWCYKGSEGLVFGSSTFNSYTPGMTYMNGQYYLNDDPMVHLYEQQLMTSCFNSWKSNNFDINWRCRTADVPLAISLTGGSGAKGSAAECKNNCDCFSSKGAMHATLAWVSVLNTLLVLYI